MSERPWFKFYPRDWRGDQALRLVSLPARGLWIEMMCLMHEATPYGHLLVGGQPLSEVALARVVGSGVEEVQALLVELHTAGVSRKTRAGVIYSKRMTDDYKRSLEGKKAKLEALGKVTEKPGPSRGGGRGARPTPSTQKPESRAKVEGPSGSSTLSDGAAVRSTVPADVRAAFAKALGWEWVVSYIDPCAWLDTPRTLIPANGMAAGIIANDGRRALRQLADEGLGVVLGDRSAAA
jgi:hypothetical protein